MSATHALTKSYSFFDNRHVACSSGEKEGENGDDDGVEKGGEKDDNDNAGQYEDDGKVR